MKRPLTVGEIALASSIYGNTIDYSKVFVHTNKWASFMPNDRAHAPNGSLYFPPDSPEYYHAQTDLSLGSDAAMATFIHEMAHVYQSQHGQSVKLNAFFANLFHEVGLGPGYDYREVFSGTRFNQLNVEQRAAMIQDYFIKANGGRFHHNDPNKAYKEALSLQDYLDRLPPDIVAAIENDFDLIEELENPHCFPASTPIQTSPTSTTPISELTIGDTVLAFDPSADLGRGALVPRRISQLFRNVTTEWLKISWQENGARHELISTPNHHFLDERGQFATIAELLLRGGGVARIVVASGEVALATAVRICYSADTAHLFERAQSISVGHGNLSVKPQMLDGWQSYNFEVEELHTYVAGGVRVHNDSRVIIDTAGSIGQFVQLAAGKATFRVAA